LSYFGDESEACGSYDNCDNPPETFDGTIAAQRGQAMGRIYGAEHLSESERMAIVAFVRSHTSEQMIFQTQSLQRAVAVKQHELAWNLGYI
jgi:superfamily II DNA helicase RecQ